MYWNTGKRVSLLRHIGQEPVEYAFLVEGLAVGVSCTSADFKQEDSKDVTLKRFLILDAVVVVHKQLHLFLSQGNMLGLLTLNPVDGLKVDVLA